MCVFVFSCLKVLFETGNPFVLVIMVAVILGVLNGLKSLK